MELHQRLSHSKACNLAQCCICCECCSVPTCVLCLGILTSIGTPIVLALLLTSVHILDIITKAVVFLFGTAFLVGFYSGYCAKKAWGNWLMFYVTLGWIGAAILVNIILLVLGVDAIPGQRNQYENSGFASKYTVFEEVDGLQTAREYSSVDSVFIFVKVTSILLVIFLDSWIACVLATYANSC